MPILKYKKDGAWETLAEEFPVDVPIEVTEMDADLTTLNATQNGSYAAAPAYDAFDKVNVNVSVLPAVIRAGDTPVLMTDKAARTTSTSSLVATDVKLTIPRDGTYRIKWGIGDIYGSYSAVSRLYRTRNGQTTAVGTEHTSTVDDATKPLYEDLALEAGDEVTVWIKGYSEGYWGTYGAVIGLYACIDWDIWG